MLVEVLLDLAPHPAGRGTKLRSAGPPGTEKLASGLQHLLPVQGLRREGDGTQLALSTASIKLSVLVSTHSGDTASTPIVPMRSVLVVITLTFVAAGLMSR